MVTLLRAPNPSAMTLDGTNGYIIRVGPGALVAIDPGVDDDRHIGSFLRIAGEAHATFAAILVTHGHPDHYPGALALRRATGAPIFAHGSATYGHDRSIDEGTNLTYEDATLRVLYAPGHARDHLVFWLEEERALFTGDVIIGTGTVVIAPPAGDMRDYQATLERLLRDYGHARVIHGGHGPSIHSPRAKLREYIDHRKHREAQLVARLERGPATIPDLVTEVYANVNESLRLAAARQMLAYLIALEREGRVTAATVERLPSDEEARLLNPDVGSLARPQDAGLVRAELGLGPTRQPFLQYTLVR